MNLSQICNLRTPKTGLNLHRNAPMRAVKLSQKIAGIFVVGLAFYAQANPTGMTVASGSATSSSSGSRLTITTSQTALLNWQSFNIAAGETTIFNQPSVSSVVMNNIHDANASQIFGNLEANGIVVLTTTARSSATTRSS